MFRTIRTFLPSLAVLLLVAACSDLPTSTLSPSADLDPTSVPHLDEAAGCVTDGVCVLDPIVVGPGECDPYLSLNGCEEECEESAPGSPEVVGADGCYDPGGTDPGTGGGTDPPPSGCPEWDPDCDQQAPQPDPCDTGDAVVDDPQVSEGLQDLWAASNPDAPLYQRRETAGWIVEYPAGQFSIVPISTTSSSFGCAEIDVQFPATGTIVGFVHTHPYQVDETIVDCELTNVQDYTGAPSDEDRVASGLLGNALGRAEPLPGYIIDKDGYYRFEGSRYTATPRLPRCGY